MRVVPASLIYQSQAAGHSAFPGLPIVSNRSAPSTSKYYRPGRCRRDYGGPRVSGRPLRSDCGRLATEPTPSTLLDIEIVRPTRAPGQVLQRDLLLPWGFIPYLT